MKLIIKNMCQECFTVTSIIQIGDSWVCLSCLKLKIDQFEKLLKKSPNM